MATDNDSTPKSGASGETGSASAPQASSAPGSAEDLERQAAPAQGAASPPPEPATAAQPPPAGPAPGELPPGPSAAAEHGAPLRGKRLAVYTLAALGVVYGDI